MDQKLKEKLPSLTLETLARLDRGKFARQFDEVYGHVVDNISRYPVSQLNQAMIDTREHASELIRDAIKGTNAVVFAASP